MIHLAILLAAMQRKWDDGDYDGAAALARVAAPYLHPRVLAARPSTDLATLADQDLDALRPHDGARTQAHNP